MCAQTHGDRRWNRWTTSIFKIPRDINPAGHQSVWGSWFDLIEDCGDLRVARPPAKRLQPVASLPTLPPQEALPESGTKKNFETTWRPRGDFETSEGFVVHASIYLAFQWLKCLQDGTLSARADCFDVDVRKVLLSEQAAKESLEQVKKFGRRLDDGKVPQKLAQSLEEFCICVGEREYVKANKAYMDIVMGARKWQGDVPYLVEGNRNGPSVVQNVAERINKVNANPVDEAGIRDTRCYCGAWWKWRRWSGPTRIPHETVAEEMSADSHHLGVSENRVYIPLYTSQIAIFMGTPMDYEVAHSQTNSCVEDISFGSL